MAARKRGDKWFVDFMVAGERRRVFGFSTELEAAAWEAAARLALAQGKPPPKTTAEAAEAGAIRTVTDLIHHCAASQWASRISGAALARQATIFAAFVGPNLSPAEALTTTQIAAFVKHVRDRGRMVGTVNHYMSVISVLVKHALSMGIIERRPVLVWGRPPPGKDRDFSLEQERELLATARLWGFHREAALFEFLADTGCRLGEALRARPEHITPGGVREPNRITFPMTKNGKSRTIPLTDRAFRAFMEHGGFPDIVEHRVRKLWERLRERLPWITDATIHTFRHTCACRLVRSGIDLYRVMLWLGHSSIAVTQRYARFAPRHLAELATALEQPKE